MKKLLILLLTLAFTSVTFAEKVTEQQALKKAQKFFKDKRIESKNLSRGSKAELNPNATQEDFFVFNAENKGGFVIISGDDRTPEILGYADSGNLDMDNLPPNLKGWLEEYSKQIKALEDVGETSSNALSRAPSRAAKTPIEPLITTQWGQESPYNNQCPEIDGKHCVTGCVATVMAQVMYYHKWPQDACAAIPQYTTETRQIEMPALPPTTFKWSAMRDRYWDGEQGESADAVAELMRYCGQAVEMNYDIDGSSAFVSPQDLLKYFGYGKNAKYIEMAHYTMPQWEDILYEEISEGRPILYAGDATFVGHEFICDGYDGDGFYHFNWGWDGFLNGYFRLSLFTYGAFYNFVLNQRAIIGLQPDKGEPEKLDIYSYNPEELSQTEYLRSSISEDFTEISLLDGVSIQDAIPEGQEILLDYGLGLYKDTQLLAILDYSSAVLNSSVNADYSQIKKAFGKDLEDGIYQLRTIYKLTGNDNWKACEDAYANYILATISGNILVLRKINASTGNTQYKVNSVTYLGKLLPGRALDVKVNLTNIGDTNQELLYFIQREGEHSICGYGFACGTIEPGKTGDVVFPIYVGGNYGNATLQITSDLACEKVMWEETVNFVEPADQHLTCSNIIIDNYKNGILRGSQYHLTVSITNCGDNIYDEKIICQCQELNRSGKGQLGHDIEKPLKLNPRETTQVEFTFNLDNNKNYNVYLLYYSKDIETFEEFPQGEYFQVVTQEIKYNGLNFAYSTSPNTACVVRGDYKNMESVIIPASIMISGTSYSVTEIGLSAFKDCHLKSVVLPEGMLAIGNDAFMFNYIETISFPSTLLSIGYQAFMYTNGLKIIALPEGLKHIRSYAFCVCRDLEILSFPSTIESISYGVINGCHNLKAVYSAMINPLEVEDNTFAAYYDDNGTPMPPSATLYVPKGSVSKYQGAAGWNLFTRITDKLPYKLNYYVDGDIFKSYEIEEETAITLETEPTKDGYNFSGWDEIPAVMPDHDVTVTGSFTPINYAITYELNGGVLAEDVTNPPTYTIESETFTLNNPTRDGYSFAGWTGTDLTETTTSVTINKGSTDARAYTANWKKLLTNGITVETIADQVYKGGGIEPTVIVKDGEIIITNDCNVVFTDNTNVGIANVTITAKATSTSYDGEMTITFKIIPKTVGLNWSETTTFDCDDTEKTITAIATGLEGLDVCNVTLSGNKATEVGKYTATITALDNANYQLPATGLTCDYEILRKMENLFNGSSYWTGYVAQEDLDLPTGLTAYTVTSLGTESAIATSLDYIPKDEPVLLTRTDTEVNLFRASAGTGTASNGNMLQIASATNQPTAFQDYVLYKDAFVLVNGGTLADGKVFLRVPQDNLSRASIYAIAINGDNATIIKSLFDDQYHDLYDQWYTIEGRKLDGKPTRKGLYIHNGKKEVVK